jgi:GDP-L-fucose synthase
VVRPANIYGPYANFDPENSMVIASLIRRIFNGENPLVVWGNGTAIRDFIFSGDVASGMVDVMQNKIEEPINIGSGTGVSIKKLVNTILSNPLIKKKPKVIFDKTKPSGDKKRILDTRLAKSYGIESKISLEEGLAETINWYLKNRHLTKKRFNYFKKY